MAVPLSAIVIAGLALALSGDHGYGQVNTRTVLRIGALDNEHYSFGEIGAIAVDPGLWARPNGAAGQGI